MTSNAKTVVTDELRMSVSGDRKKAPFLHACSSSTSKWLESMHYVKSWRPTRPELQVCMKRTWKNDAIGSTEKEKRLVFQNLVILQSRSWSTPTACFDDLSALFHCCPLVLNAGQIRSGCRGGRHAVPSCSVMTSDPVVGVLLTVSAPTPSW